MWDALGLLLFTFDTLPGCGLVDVLPWRFSQLLVFCGRFCCILDNGFHRVSWSMHVSKSRSWPVG